MGVPGPVRVSNSFSGIVSKAYLRPPQGRGRDSTPRPGIPGRAPSEIWRAEHVLAVDHLQIAVDRVVIGDKRQSVGPDGDCGQWGLFFGSPIVRTTPATELALRAAEGTPRSPASSRPTPSCRARPTHRRGTGTRTCWATSCGVYGPQRHESNCLLSTSRHPQLASSPPIAYPENVRCAAQPMKPSRLLEWRKMSRFGAPFSTTYEGTAPRRE